MKKKVIIPVLAAMLVLCMATVGTVAYITSVKHVKNVFVIGNISLTLEEDDYDGDEDPDYNEFDVKPNDVVAKAPKITVGEGSEDCWLFLELDESDNLDTFIEYTVNSAWTKLTGISNDNVYYIQYTGGTEEVYYALAGTGSEGDDTYNGCVTVKNVDTETIEGNSDDIYLEVYVGAIQADDSFTSAALAWTALAGEDDTLVEADD